MAGTSAQFSWGATLSDKTEQDLRHALGNAKAESEALKSMLGKAAERLEDIVAADCAEEEQEKAIVTARRLRMAIARSNDSKAESAADGRADNRDSDASSPPA